MSVKSEYVRAHADELIRRYESGEHWNAIAESIGYPRRYGPCVTEILSRMGKTWVKRGLCFDDGDDFSKEFTMRITAAQRTLFWRLFQEACFVHGVPQANQNDYRYGLIEQACGKRSLKDVNKTDEFDALLLVVARAASNLEMVDKLLGAKMERWGFRICDNIRIITGNKTISRADIIAYCEGILTRKYGRPCHIQDCADWWMNLTEEAIEFLVKSTSVAARRREGKVRFTTKRA